MFDEVGGVASIVESVRRDVEILAVADGGIVGSDLKVDGDSWNPVDPDRASRFIAEVRAARGA